MTFNNSLCTRGPCYDGVDRDHSKTMNTEQQTYIQKCLNLAHKSNLTQKHGCVLVRRKKIISCGYNFKIQNTFLMKKQNNDYIFSVHAEISTIKKVKNQDLSECELYVVRLGPKSKCYDMKYSHPCKACHTYIENNRIKKVYYSINP
jgi:deoxycytidylate deaminase